MTLRPDWRTVDRRHWLARPTAYASADGVCPWCGAEVVAAEPIVHVGTTAIVDDGAKRLDLTDAEWICQRCAAPATAIEEGAAC